MAPKWIRFGSRDGQYPIKMSSILTGILTSAERIGKAQASLLLAKNGEEILKYQTEASLVEQCVRNSFMELVTFKSAAHPVASPQYDPSKTELQNCIMLQLITKAMALDSWTFGDKCAWLSGELYGYHYSAYFKPTSSGHKMGYVRITIDEIAHQCNDCS